MRTRSTIGAVIGLGAAVLTGWLVVGDPPANRGAPSSAAPADAGMTRQIPDAVRRSCAEAAEEVTIAVLCPTVVPDDRVVKALGYGAITVPGHDAYYELTFNNASGRHWVVGRGLRREVRKFILDGPSAARHLGTTNRRDRAVDFYAFSEHPRGGLHGGHVGAFTTVGRLSRSS